MPLPLAPFVPTGRRAIAVTQSPHADLLDVFGALAEAAAGLTAAADAVYAVALGGGPAAPALAAARGALREALETLANLA